MRYYPAMLDINDRKCLVVGGGAVGLRKTKTLVECGAKVIVISLDVCPELEDMAQKKIIALQNASYEANNLEGVFLVIGATDDEKLNARISTDANKKNILCNIADQPKVCNFILPSIVHQKDLVISISTSGKSPAFAKKLRKDLEKQFGPEYGIFLDLMGAIRKKLLAQAHAPEEHKPLFNQLIDGNFLNLLAKQDKKNINKLLLDVLGPGFKLEELL